MGGFTAALQRFGIGRLAMVLGVGAGVAAVLVALMLRVGETPREFQARYAAAGAPRIPGCYVFMWGLVETGGRTASEEKRDR